VLLDSVPNGEKYLIRSSNDSRNYLYIVRVKGTAYEMGKAYGELFKEELQRQMDGFYNYYIRMAQEEINKLNLPPFFAKFISTGKNIE
jgi:hypothetical protein